jgi:hypothetical protein
MRLLDGLLAAAGTPKNAISQFADLFTAALQASEVKGKLVAQTKLDAVPAGSNLRAD